MQEFTINSMMALIVITLFACFVNIVFLAIRSFLKKESKNETTSLQQTPRIINRENKIVKYGVQRSGNNGHHFQEKIPEFRSNRVSEKSNERTN